MTSCDARRELCGRSADALAATDWGEPPVVVWDESPKAMVTERILDTGKRLLELAVDTSDDLFVYLEDDVEFNASLRHNLHRWEPVVERRSGDYLFASLYNPAFVSLPSPDNPTPVLVVDPRHYYGTQGVLLSVATAQCILDRWDDRPGALDLRMSRLAARRSPLLVHHPSLVQHRAVPSTWGGEVHRAVDFSQDWRA